MPEAAFTGSHFLLFQMDFSIDFLNWFGLSIIKLTQRRRAASDRPYNF